jgi:hypothetical protein
MGHEVNAAGRYLGRTSRVAIATNPIPSHLLVLLVIGFALVATGCSNQKIRSETQQSSKTTLVSPMYRRDSDYPVCPRCADHPTSGVWIVWALLSGDRT